MDTHSVHPYMVSGFVGYPIIGRLFDVSQGKTWLTYDSWFKAYGDMVYFKELGQGFLILGSVERTKDLLEKRAANYSDRPGLPMIIELMEWDIAFSLLPYGQWWRRHRRAFHEHFRAGVSYKYQPTQLREARTFLRRLFRTPEKFGYHIRDSFSAMIMDVTYGIKISETDDPYISTAEEAVNGISQAAIPGQFIVDFLPILNYVPSWMPGASFRRKAKYWKSLNVEMMERPFEHVKQPLTVSSVQFLFLAMAMHPDVQRKAQAELDMVVGPNRLPNFNDRDSLPYITSNINAIVKETMRWQLVAPLAMGHMSTRDDEYDGYLIPKGTLVLGNNWTILHNHEVYPLPDEYKPERWLKYGTLNTNIPNPDIAAFEFGCRVCPGRHFSDDSLYAMASSILSVYNISPPVDKSGNQIHLKPESTSGLLSYARFH
ncbi:cytochrome P450 [Collybia nuda]|uniref:Cytochrome P450 n=1 Tax=Collybia nuda TaxID=64659 RepID=A0A9P5YDT4_9AGAR|nr:cytochrome P450 [Collybia nuda]